MAQYLTVMYYHLPTFSASEPSVVIKPSFSLCPKSLRSITDFWKCFVTCLHIKQHYVINAIYFYSIVLLTKCSCVFVTEEKGFFLFYCPARLRGKQVIKMYVSVMLMYGSSLWINVKGLWRLDDLTWSPLSGTCDSHFWLWDFWDSCYTITLLELYYERDSLLTCIFHCTAKQGSLVWRKHVTL